MDFYLLDVHVFIIIQFSTFEYSYIRRVILLFWESDLKYMVIFPSKIIIKPNTLIFIKTIWQTSNTVFYFILIFCRHLQVVKFSIWVRIMF